MVRLDPAQPSPSHNLLLRLLLAFHLPNYNPLEKQQLPPQKTKLTAGLELNQLTELDDSLNHCGRTSSAYEAA